MAHAQRQDLVLFSDQTVFSPVLSPGGTDNNEDNRHEMVLVTSTASSQPLWLLSALVEAWLTGAPHSLNGSSSSNSNHNSSINISHRKQTTHSATIASFLHDSAHYRNSLQRLQIDANNYQIVDLMTDFVLKELKPQTSHTTLLQNLLSKFPEDQNSLIVIDHPEFLLSLVPGLTSDELQSHFIVPLSKKCNILVMSVSTELFQDMESVDLTKSDTIELTRLITSSHYKSTVNLNLKPLQTGHARDITGTLRITKGGIPLSNNLHIHVIENEYLYLTEKESTKLFYS